MRSPRRLPELCLFLYFGMYGTYLIPKDQLYLDKACHVNMADWLADRGYNTSMCGEAAADLDEDVRKEASAGAGGEIILCFRLKARHRALSQIFASMRAFS
jgi:hypothetical protein